MDSCRVLSIIIDSRQKSSNVTVGQSSLISLTHHFYDWHPGSCCGWTCNQLTSKVDGGITEVGSGGQFSPSVWPHNPATGFWPPSATVVSPKPFSYGTATLRCLQKEMATCRLCSCGKTHTMSQIVESCPRTKLNDGLSWMHSADEDAVSWLTNYGSWHAYEKKKKNWSMCVVTSAKAEVMRSVGLPVILSVCRITAKVISLFHWNLVLWLGQPLGRTC